MSASEYSNKGVTFLSRHCPRSFENATCPERASATSAFENFISSFFTRHRISFPETRSCSRFQHDNPLSLQPKRRPLKLHLSHTPNLSLASLISSLALPPAFPFSAEKSRQGKEARQTPFILRPHHYEVLFCSPCWILISFTAARGGGTDIPHTLMTDQPA